MLDDLDANVENVSDLMLRKITNKNNSISNKNRRVLCSQNLKNQILWNTFCRNCMVEILLEVFQLKRKRKRYQQDLLICTAVS